MKTIFTFAFIIVIAISAYSQENLPIIDMHAHALSADPPDIPGPPPMGMCVPIYPMPKWDQNRPYSEVFRDLFKHPPCDDPVWSPMTDSALMMETIAAMERLNMYGVLSGTPKRVATWMKVAPERFYPGILFSPGFKSSPTPEELRTLNKSGKLSVLGEISSQYAGIAPNDELMEPYWDLAEELDIPVAIHMGPGPPGATYLGFGFRARLSSPLLLEEVLVRRPKLRVYIMHAGYPMLDDLLALLYVHPQVYVDISVIVYTQPRPAFYRYLKAIIDAGFGNRVMFGTDAMQWPGVIERAVAVIREVPFLSQKQKRNIFYNNAARFLRLSEEEIAKHHAKK